MQKAIEFMHFHHSTWKIERTLMPTAPDSDEKGYGIHKILSNIQLDLCRELRLGGRRLVDTSAEFPAAALDRCREYFVALRSSPIGGPEP